VYHAITFFDAAPRALGVVHVGSKRVPSSWSAPSHYAAWLVASAVVFWLVLGVVNDQRDRGAVPVDALQRGRRVSAMLMPALRSVRSSPFRSDG